MKTDLNSLKIGIVYDFIAVYKNGDCRKCKLMRVGVERFVLKLYRKNIKPLSIEYRFVKSTIDAYFKEFRLVTPLELVLMV